jgi:hypothetical protein
MAAQKAERSGWQSLSRSHISKSLRPCADARGLTMTAADAAVPMGDAPTIWTIGHSTRPLDDFVALLRENRIALLFDVRRFPGSRRHPQFGSEALAQALADAGRARIRRTPHGGCRRSAAMPITWLRRSIARRWRRSCAPRASAAAR